MCVNVHLRGQRGRQMVVIQFSIWKKDSHLHDSFHDMTYETS